MSFRIGHGFDLHRLEDGRPLMLGGVHVETSAKGAVGHSDSDVVLHALTDAILGALGQGDIGDAFPPSDPQWQDANSDVFLSHALALMAEKGYRLENIDVTIVLETPKLGVYKQRIKTYLATRLQLPEDAVSIKAKTAEGILGELGSGDAIYANATVLLTYL